MVSKTTGACGTKMIEIIGLIVLLAVSVVVFSGWLFLEGVLSSSSRISFNHPKSDFIIHMFTGLGSGWLIGLWMPKMLALVLGVTLVVMAAIIRYVIPTAKLPEKLKSSGMGQGLPVGLDIAWLTYPWIPEILTLILGATSMVGAEIVHYVFPNLFAKKKVLMRKTSRIRTIFGAYLNIKA